MARRAGLVEEIRKIHSNVLLVDSGDTFTDKMDMPALRGEAVLSGMGVMKYDAVTVGEGEVSLGIDFLEKMAKETDLPFVIANMDDTGRPRDWIKPYVIKKYKGLRVGVIGIGTPIFYDVKNLSEQGIRLKGPAEVLKELIPELRKKVDFVVLLSHLGDKGTADLLRFNDIKGIDVAVAGHGRRLTEEPETINGTLLVMCSMSGEYIGQLTLEIHPDGPIAGYTNEMVALTEDIKEEKKALEIMEAFQQERARLQEEAEARKREEQEKEQALQTKFLKMTPEEFVNMMKKENEKASASGKPATPPMPECN